MAKTNRLHIRVTDEEKAEMVRAAKEAGVDFSTWATDTLMLEAGWLRIRMTEQEEVSLRCRAQVEGAADFEKWLKEKALAASASIG